MENRKCKLCGAPAIDPVFANDDFCGPCDAAICEAMSSPAADAVGVERARQDLKWGGPAHDARHSQQVWHDILHRLLDEAETASRNGDPDAYRQHLVEAGATVLAAIEAHDRREGTDD